MSVLNTIVYTYEDVEKVLYKLNKFKYPGPDNLIPSAHICAWLLTYMCLVIDIYVLGY